MTTAGQEVTTVVVERCEGDDAKYTCNYTLKWQPTDAVVEAVDASRVVPVRSFSTKDACEELVQPLTRRSGRSLVAALAALDQETAAAAAATATAAAAVTASTSGIAVVPSLPAAAAATVKNRILGHRTEGVREPRLEVRVRRSYWGAIPVGQLQTAAPGSGDSNSDPNQ